MSVETAESAVREVTFQDALAATADRRRHLLLGNGFSIAAHPPFRYSSLHAVAVKMNPSIEGLFEEAQTTNFEVAIEASFDKGDASSIKLALIKAIAKIHPYYSLSLTDDECRWCGAFLEHFVGWKRGEQRGAIFTANYDLLLYWVIVRQSVALGCHDGFDQEGYWSETPSSSQVFYLHGGLHLFERRYQGAVPRLTKLLYERERVLTRQIAERLNRGEFPLFVTEGTSLEKLARIHPSRYLSAAHERFASACVEEGSALFIVGHGLGESDEHITDIVGRAQLQSVFVSTFGQADRERVEVLCKLWNRRRAMDGLPPFEVSIFDVAGCAIWSEGGSSDPATP
jgi:hypothetical protein